MAGEKVKNRRHTNAHEEPDADTTIKEKKKKKKKERENDEDREEENAKKQKKKDRKDKRDRELDQEEEGEEERKPAKKQKKKRERGNEEEGGEEKVKKKTKKKNKRARSPSSDDVPRPASAADGISKPGPDTMKARLHRVLSCHDPPRTAAAQPPRGFFTAFALSLSSPLRRQALDLFNSWWGDESGQPYLAQTYHVDGPSAGVPNFTTWGQIGGPAAEVRVLTATGKGAETGGTPSVRDEQEGADTAAESRSLLRLTDAGAKAVRENAQLRQALEGVLRDAKSGYMRLVKVEWPRAAGRPQGHCTLLPASGRSTGRHAGDSSTAPYGSATDEEVDTLLKDGNVTASPGFHPFTFCELFAGLGGFRIGLEACGGRCVFASEINPVCQAVYAGRWGEVTPEPEPEMMGVKKEKDGKGKGKDGEKGTSGGPVLSRERSEPSTKHLHGDITKIPSSSIPDHDLLVGGFPCQPFSRLGAQDGFRCGRGLLYLDILRVLRDKRPKMFLLENVPGIADEKGAAASWDENCAARHPEDCNQHGGSATSSAIPASQQQQSPLQIILSDLTLDGLYQVSHKIYSSAPLTVQHRKRVYFVGVLQEDGKKRRKIKFPEEVLPDLGLRAKHVIQFDFGGTSPARVPLQARAGTAEPDATEAEFVWDPERSLRLSPAQFGTLYSKLPALQLSKDQNWPFVFPETKFGPLVSHYGHSPQHGASQLVARPSDSSEGGVPRVMSFEEGLRVMGMNPADFLPDMEEWARNGFHNSNQYPYRVAVKKALYSLIGNAVCPPLIAWLAEKVVLPAGGFVDKKGPGGETPGGASLPGYLRLAIAAIREDLV